MSERRSLDGGALVAARGKDAAASAPCRFQMPCQPRWRLISLTCTRAATSPSPGYSVEVPLWPLWSSTMRLPMTALISDAHAPTLRRSPGPIA